MAYDIKGSVKLINEVQTFASGFTKREFVVTTDDDYPQDVKFECIKERCGLLDSIAVGDRVSVSFNIRGNEYNDRYYVNLQAWRIEKDDAAPSEEGPSLDQLPPPDEDDDLDVGF